MVMKSLTAQLTDHFADAFEAIGLERSFGAIVVSNRLDLGQFQCNGALAAAKTLSNGQRKQPRDLAQDVIDALDAGNSFFEASVAGPGFINITLADEFLAAHVQQMAGDERLGCTPLAHPRIVVIDFGGPNVAKPMHVGHLRPGIIGDCLQRLYRFMGDRVISDIHLGDWGTPMGMLICELKRRQPNLPYFEMSYTGPYPEESPVTIPDLQEIYPAASARCQQDKTAMAAALQATVELQQGRPGYRALWRHFVKVSVQEFKAEYSHLGISFDLWLGESDYHDQISGLIEKLQQAGHVQMSAGALIIPLEQPPDRPEIPPLILVKSDGGYLYGTTDLATIAQRVEEFKADEVIYVVDARQSLHFEQLFRAAYQTGLAEGVKLRHVGFGTTNGPDGKPFKTRAGGVMRLKELMEMATVEALERLAESGLAQDAAEKEQLAIAEKVGLAALKYADLMNHYSSDYIFDMKKFTQFQGRTGPYLLYTAVRINSILRNAASRGLEPGLILPPTERERDLMLVMAQLPDALQTTYLNYAPSHLCEYAYNLAQSFNRFYSQCYILGEKDGALQASWLALVQFCLAQLELILSLLGIKVPERM